MNSGNSKIEWQLYKSCFLNDFLYILTHERIPIMMLSKQIAYPLTFQQEGLWFLSQLNTESPVWNNYSIKRLKGKLNIDYLKQALGKVVERHSALNMQIKILNDRPFQMYSNTETSFLKYIDLSSHNEKEREEEAKRISQHQINISFNFVNDFLFRFILIKLDEQDHIIILIIHHIISDEKTFVIFWKDLAEFYNYFNGKTLSLREIDFQYHDYVLRQHEQYNNEYLDKEKHYWLDQFKDYSQVLNLPHDYEIPTTQNFNGVAYGKILNPELIKRLNVFSFRNRMISFSVYLSAYFLLMQKYSQQDDIVIGSVFSGRDRDIRSIDSIGYFINTVAIRLVVSENIEVLDFIKQLNNKVNEAYKMQYYPLERLVKQINPKRDAGRTPLYQVMFNMISDSKENIVFFDLEEKDWMQGKLMASQVDLTLTVVDRRKDLEVQFEYRTDLFKEETIKRMIDHYINILSNIIESPKSRLSEIDLLSGAEHAQILVDWNDTVVEYPHDKCIHELFEEQVERTPDAIAVVFKDDILTYGELNRRSNQLAHYLRSLGVELEVSVGICMERSLEMIIGILGILKAGGAYVPLDPDCPEARLCFMIEDSQLTTVLTQRKYTQLFSDIAKKNNIENISLIYPETDLEVIKEESKEPFNRVTSENLAYIIYTSGSTGKPKGVRIQHQPVINLIDWAIRRFRFDENDCGLFVAALNFDLSVYDIFGILACGGMIYIAGDKERTDAEYLARILSEEHITFWNSAPAVLQMVIPSLEAGLIRNQGMRLFFLSGDWIPVGLPEDVRKYFTKAEVISLGGATEATVWSNYYVIEEVDPEWRSIPYGKPMQNAQYYILDKNLSACPLGVVGDLYIGGECLSEGYLNAFDLTAEKFIPNPFSRKEGQRIYKTGDLARYYNDGNIEFIGRIDNQVKIRGYRIELGEIEAKLYEVEGIKEGAVLAREDQLGEKQLVAYIVPSQEQAADISYIRSCLKEKLPDYMIPNIFVMLDEMPLTTNGKVDRRSLPVPDKSELEKEYVAPCTEVEKVLAEIWSEMLGIERIGKHDNFFEIGGHSLIAFQMLSRINKKFSINMQIQTIFERQTMEELADQIANELQSNSNLFNQNESYDEVIF
jgi:amino acid adenylation domain-containing protein